MWFLIHENMLQDDKNLPVLFNCFVQGAGGFECYFKGKQIYFRSLGKQYNPPSKTPKFILNYSFGIERVLFG